MMACSMSASHASAHVNAHTPQTHTNIQPTDNLTHECTQKLKSHFSASKQLMMWDRALLGIHVSTQHRPLHITTTHTHKHAQS